MTDIRFVNADVPPEVLSYFGLRDGILCWADRAPPKSQHFRKSNAPWGNAAGGRYVFGRGRLVTVANCNLLTVDIAYALAHGGEWAWQHGATVPAYGVPADGAVEIMKLMCRERFALDGDTLVWKVRRGDHEAGSPAVGMALSGFRGRMLSTGGAAFLASDVIELLKTSVFPFEWTD